MYEDDVGYHVPVIGSGSWPKDILFDESKAGQVQKALDPYQPEPIALPIAMLLLLTKHLRSNGDTV